jgi:hypothetical protein
MTFTVKESTVNAHGVCVIARTPIFTLLFTFPPFFPPFLRTKGVPSGVYAWSKQ